MPYPEKCNGTLHQEDKKEMVWVTCTVCDYRAGYSKNQNVPKFCPVLKGDLYIERNKNCPECNGNWRGVLLLNHYSPCKTCRKDNRQKILEANRKTRSRKEPE